MTVQSAARQLQQSLSAIYEPEEAGRIVDMIMEPLTGMSRSERICYPENILSAQQEAQYFNYREQLLAHRPVQYVLAHTEFYGIPLFVDESVLIPRPETEELVDLCLKWLKENNNASGCINVLDIGTGSGCIALALRKHLPKASVFAADASEAALKTARKNAELNRLDVCFVQWNILASAMPAELPRKFDVVVSNPPYITMAEKLSMAAHVVDFEPHEALFVTNNDPLQFYKSIEQLGRNVLVSSGAMFLELHEQFAGDTGRYFADTGWRAILKKDFQQKDRMLVVSRHG